MTETAWLIEYASNKWNPARYWAAGEPHPVVDPNHATRFARREDAVAVMGAYAATQAKPVEHSWVDMLAPARGEAMNDAQWLREQSENLVRYEEDAQRLRKIATRLERAEYPTEESRNA